MSEKEKHLIHDLELMYPDAACELNHQNIEQLTIAVILSAQTTDKQVNIVTPELFTKYPSLEELAQADIKDIELCIRRLGLYKTKAKNIKKMAQQVLSENNGKMPDTIEALIKLPGIGRKTANVIINVGFGKPGFAVDTHVERVSKRLKIVPESANVLQIEKILKTKFPQELWGKLHHQFIFFGRYFCTARNPKCVECSFQKYCLYYQKKRNPQKDI